MFKIKVLGTGCANCVNTEKLIQQVLSDNSIPGTVEKVEDIVDIASYGVMSTPGVVIDEKVAHVGSVPDKKLILSWFKSTCCPSNDSCC